MTCAVEPDSAQCPRGEHGFVLVWMAITLMLLLGVTAIAVDLVHAYLVQQEAQNAVDAASLAGVVDLPGDPTAAVADAKRVAAANGYADGADGVTLTVTPNAANSTLQVQASRTFDTYFAGVMGFKSLTVNKSSTAKFDPPKGLASKLDVVMIIDRTGSMVGPDMQNARDAADALLGYLDPTLDAVALGMLGPSSTTTTCGGAGHGVPAPVATGTWIVSPFPNTTPDTNYQVAGGGLNTNDPLVQTITCAGTSSVGTDLTTPILRATTYLQTFGRPGAKHVILLETDGQPNTSTNACEDAANAAGAASAAGIQIETVGFGLDGANDVNCPDPVGTPWHNVKVTTLLATMATPMDGVPAADRGCTAEDNTNGDGFFCEPKSVGLSDDLGNVFVQAISQVAPKRDPRLVK